MNNSAMPGLTPTQRAAAWLTRQPLFLDTETTGLDDYAEICEIAVIDHTSQVLLNTLVRPTQLISAGALAVHGITDDEVTSAPGLDEIFPQLAALLAGRLVVVYNASFDRRVLIQSLRANRLYSARLDWEWACAMELYAEHRGDYNRARRSYRWQSLDAAARQCRVAVSGPAHRALADAETCRQIVLHMAGPAQAASEP